MNDTKITLSTEWLSICGGCHAAVADMHVKIKEVIKGVEIVRSPMSTETDKNVFPNADIGLISGAVRTERDIDLAKKMRASCKTIVAYGTCAVLGGIPKVALNHFRRETVGGVYKRRTAAETNSYAACTALSEFVRPLDEIIKIDLYLTGCPPHASYIFDALLSLTKGRPPKAKQETICARCNRAMEKRDTVTVKNFLDGIPEADVCFLSQGYLCMGSVTLDRCLAPCPSNGMPCTGCTGPTKQILTEPNKDIKSELELRMSKLTKIDKIEMRDEIEKFVRNRYLCAMAAGLIQNNTSFFAEKQTENMQRVQ